MHKVGFTFKCSVHNMESSLPPRIFEHKHVQESIDKRKEATKLATRKMLSNKIKKQQIKTCSTERDECEIERHFRRLIHIVCQYKRHILHIMSFPQTHPKQKQIGSQA